VNKLSNVGFDNRLEFKWFSSLLIFITLDLFLVSFLYIFICLTFYWEIVLYILSINFV